MIKMTYEEFVETVIKRWQSKEPKELPSVIQRFLDNMYRNYCEGLDKEK